MSDILPFSPSAKRSAAECGLNRYLTSSVLATRYADGLLLWMSNLRAEAEGPSDSAE